jgi:enoyl-CoA hydratase/carnithine racemase
VKYHHLVLGVDGPVGYLTLDRPDRLNALSEALMRELIGASAELSKSPVRAVVVSGSGRSFSAGYDMDGFDIDHLFADLPAAAGEAAKLGSRMADAIQDMRPVTVAALHGFVIGGGVVLAAACDLRVAAEDTVFAIPEVELGIPLAWGGIERLVAEIGPAMTRELVMTCRRFSAAEARAMGLLNMIVPAEDLMAAATALAEAVAARPNFPIETTKRHVNEILRGDRSRDEAADLVLAMQDEESTDARSRYLRRLQG